MEEAITARYIILQEKDKDTARVDKMLPILSGGEGAEGGGGGTRPPRNAFWPMT